MCKVYRKIGICHHVLCMFTREPQDPNDCAAARERNRRHVAAGGVDILLPCQDAEVVDIVHNGVCSRPSCWIDHVLLGNMHGWVCCQCSLGNTQGRVWCIRQVRRDWGAATCLHVPCQKCKPMEVRGDSAATATRGPLRPQDRWKRIDSED